MVQLHAQENIWTWVYGFRVVSCLHIMRKWISLVLLISAHQLLGQIDTVEVTEAESKQLRYQRRAVFVGVASDQNPVFGGLRGGLMVTAGVQYKSFLLGAMWSDFDQEIGQRIIFPNFFDLRFRHAGLFAGYQVWHQRQFSANIIAQYSIGDVVWTAVSTGEDTFRDEIAFITPSLQFEYMPIRYTWLFFSAGYRQALGVDIASTEAEDLSGLNLNFGVKLGVFWEKPHLIITDPK